MRMLFLLANGITCDSGYKNFSRIFRGASLHGKRILLIAPPKYRLESALKKACLKVGFPEEGIAVFDARDEHCLQGLFDFVYVTEGNTFEILDFMNRYHLLDFVRKAFFEDGTDYIGASAGAMIGGIDIRLAHEFDRNIPGITCDAALRLFNGTVIPHYSRTELKRFLSKADAEVLRGYSCIHSISDGKMLKLVVKLDRK